MSPSSPAATGTLSVIHTDTDQVVGTVSVGDKPSDVAVSPDASRIYVSDTHGVSVIDAATTTIAATIAVNAQRATALSPDGSILYAVGDRTGLSVVELKAGTVVDTIPLGESPEAVSVSPDGAWVYVADKDPAQRLTVVDTTTHAIVRILPGPTRATATPNVLFASEGHRAYLAYAAPGDAIGGVTVIDTERHDLLPGLEFEGRLAELSVSRDGTRLYATDTRGAVQVLDVGTGSAVGTIHLGGEPNGAAFSPDGIRLYVADPVSGTIQVINTDTAKVVGTLPVAGRPTKVSVSRVGTRLCVISHA